MADIKVVPIINQRPPFPSGPSLTRLGPPQPGKVTAELASLDDGTSLQFVIAPSEHSRRFGGNWEEAGVAQAAVQFIEFRDSMPEERTYKIVLNAYIRPGGMANDIEREYVILKGFSLRAPGKVRAHKLLFTQGVQRFRCVLIPSDMPVTRISSSGGALVAIETSITLKEIR